MEARAAQPRTRIGFSRRRDPGALMTCTIKRFGWRLSVPIRRRILRKGTAFFPVERFMKKHFHVGLVRKALAGRERPGALEIGKGHTNSDVLRPARLFEKLLRRAALCRAVLHRGQEILLESLISIPPRRPRSSAPRPSGRAERPSANRWEIKIQGRKKLSPSF